MVISPWQDLAVAKTVADLVKVGGGPTGIENIMSALLKAIGTSDI